VVAYLLLTFVKWPIAFHRHRRRSRCSEPGGVPLNKLVVPAPLGSQATTRQQGLISRCCLLSSNRPEVANSGWGMLPCGPTLRLASNSSTRPGRRGRGWRGVARLARLHTGCYCCTKLSLSLRSSNRARFSSTTRTVGLCAGEMSRRHFAIPIIISVFVDA
jgi:hypothetical protein